MAAPLLLAALSAGVGLAGMGIDIRNSLEAQELNLSEVEAQRRREAKKLALESEERQAALAQGVGAIEVAAATSGVAGIGAVVGTEVASGIRAQGIAELNFQEQMRQLDFAAEEIKRTGKAERLSAIMGGLSTGVTATHKFIKDREVE